MSIVHAGKVNAKYEPRITRGMLCQMYRHIKDGEKGLAGPGEKVTCPDCIETLRCEHNWIHKWTGRHGSDKGVDCYECSKCGLDLEIDTHLPFQEYMKTRIIPTIFDDCSLDQAEAIIWKGFKGI